MANTQAKKVNLTKRIETPIGTRYCPVVYAANGRVRPDVVEVGDHQERHPEGAYYIEWRENGKRIRLSVGKDHIDASNRQQRKQAELNAINNGVSIISETGSGHPMIAGAVAEYIDETELTKKPKTVAAYRNCAELLHRILPEAVHARHRT